MKIKYPVYRPSLNGNEKKYVNECLDSSWVSSKGKFVNKFEQKFAEYIGVKYAAAVTNGTAALHLAMLALGIGEGDEVIVPTLTYIASVNAITYTGAKPVFVDSLEETWEMDSGDVLKKLSKNTKAILCVHLYGHPCEMNNLLKITRDNNLFLIEDCAEAIGSKYNDEYVGSFGDISIFSFYGNKTITTGEGGMVLTNDETIYDRVVHFKGQGLAKFREYWHDVIGYNYRMTNVCAAIGLAQLEQINSIIIKKRQIAEWYKEGLEGSQYVLQSEADGVFHSYWMCSILVPENIDRDALREHLKANGIETRPVFYPAHTMPMYSQKYERHVVAENLGWRGISFPSYPDLEKSDISFIIKCLLGF